MARDRRQKETGVPHVHFDGAGGNIGAGKWNDGSHENRQVLAARVAEGMARAWEATKKSPIKAADLGWEAVPVALPPAPHLDEGRLLAALENKAAKVGERAKAANDLAWLRRCKAGDAIDVACLRLRPGAGRPPARGLVPAGAGGATRSRSPACGSGRRGGSTCRASCSSSTSSPPRRCSPAGS